MTEEESKARIPELVDVCRRAGPGNVARLTGFTARSLDFYRNGRQVPKEKFWRRFDRQRWRLEKIAETWQDRIDEQNRELARIGREAVMSKSRATACRQNFERIRDEELNVYGHRIGFATLYQKSRKAGDGVGFVWCGKGKTYYFTCSVE